MRRAKLSTEWDAWRKVEPHLKELHLMVYVFFYWVGPRGATAQDVEDYYAKGKNVSTYRSRVPELGKDCRLYRTGEKRLNSKGNPSYVWVADIYHVRQDA